MADLFPPVSRPRGDDGKRQTAHVIRCSRCPAEDAVTAHMTRYTTQHLAGTFQQRGWRVSQSARHVCPACQRAEAEARSTARAAPLKEKPAMPAATPAAVPPVSNAAPVERQAGPPSPAASSAIVNLYVRLEDSYDRLAKAYRADWTDERVAKETGLSVEAVAKRREADFGPLVVDTTPADLRLAWAAQERALGEARVKLADLRDHLLEIGKRHTELSKLLDAVGEKAGLGALTAPAKAA
ncbi:MAG: hypothetical protein AB1698_03350 [Pseudomonadota bacterium]